MDEKNLSAKEYANKYANVSNFHMAKAYDMKADELVAGGAHPEHPAVLHLRGRATMYRTFTPEAN